jgi:hypothetical protein
VNDEQLSGGEAAAPQIENIKIIELLGKGGMSLVFKARQNAVAAACLCCWINIPDQLLFLANRFLRFWKSAASKLW